MALHKAMTIAGSDTSGGAGMEADLKTFTAMGVYGMTALTVIVAQNPKDWAHEMYPCGAKPEGLGARDVPHRHGRY